MRKFISDLFDEVSIKFSLNYLISFSVSLLQTTKSNLAHQPYYMTHSFPPGSSATLPRSGSLMRPFSPAVPIGAAVISKAAQAGRFLVQTNIHS